MSLRRTSAPSAAAATGSINLSEQQMRDLRQIFDWLDYSGDGEISDQELLVALSATSSNASLSQAAELIAEATSGAKKTVGWLEFCGLMEKALKKGEGTTAAQMFETLDVTGSGNISPDVLKEGLKKWGCDTSDHAIDKMVRYIDVDGDGMVSLQEFADALAKKPGEV